MSKSMASGNSLKQFFENIATAKVAESGEYMLATKDGSVYRVVPVTKTSQLQNDSNYATTTQVEEAKTEVEGKIPTKVSELENDSSYATTTDVANAKSEVEAEIPTKVSELSNDEGYITDSALEPYAKTEDVDSELAKKADKDDIPTKVSELENDAGYITDEALEPYATSESVEAGLAKKQDVLEVGSGIDITDNVISCTIDNNPFVFCEELPTTDIKEGKIYCIPDPDSKEEDNVWIEYYWKDDKWELMGKYEPVVDLTPYLKKEEAEATYETKEEAESALAKKADKDEIPTVPTNVSAFNNDAGYITDKELEPYDLKEDRVALIESTEDDTYVEKVVDAEGNLLMGFKENGEIDVPIGLTDDAYDLIKALAEKMGVVIPALQEWAESKFETAEQRAELIEASEDDTYVVKEVDASGDVLRGVKENGEVYIPTGLSDDAYELIKTLTDKVNEIAEYLREMQARQ